MRLIAIEDLPVRDLGNLFNKEGNLDDITEFAPLREDGIDPS